MHYFFYYIATVGRIGLLPLMPGTWGSLVALPLTYILSHVLSLEGWVIYLLLLLSLGIISSYALLKDSIETDPSYIVIDELLGQSLVLLVAGLNFQAWICAFIFFRIFDIWKPYPIKKIEEYFENGNKIFQALGIMIDDIVAAAYAIVLLVIIRYCFNIW
jgi:phosphatidylglycerophosphatase A